MNPSHVRRRILHEHTLLRERLANLENTLTTLSRGHPADVRALAEAATHLLSDLVRHTHFEDLVLGRVLSEIDAWGPVRAKQLTDHHLQQRRELRAMIAAYAELSSAEETARVTRDWIAWIRDDMREEEQDILNRNLLRDDPIAVEMEVG
jgi:hypothetical protein